MTLIEHLDELRARLFKAVLAFFICAVAAWFFYDRILELLIAPLKELPERDKILEGGKLIFTSPPEALFVRLKVTAFAGFVFALPVILWQLWRFITPGLYRRERRMAVPFVGASILLFASGTTLALMTLPQTLALLVGIAGSDFVLLPRASEYLSFVLLLVIAFGATFEFPLVLIFLSLAGIVSSRRLRKARRGAFIAVLVVAAAVTPTQDPLTMMALAIPLGLLYEATILAVHLLKR